MSHWAVYVIFVFKNDALWLGPPKVKLKYRSMMQEFFSFSLECKLLQMHRGTSASRRYCWDPRSMQNPQQADLVRKQCPIPVNTPIKAHKQVSVQLWGLEGINPGWRHIHQISRLLLSVLLIFHKLSVIRWAGTTNCTSTLNLRKAQRMAVFSAVMPSFNSRWTACNTKVPVPHLLQDCINNIFIFNSQGK